MSISRNKGQSLVELSVLLAFVIAPLMLILPYFSKLIEARHYNDMAARYIAFEKTVWLEKGPENYANSGYGRLAVKQTTDISKEVPDRVFGKIETAINSSLPSSLVWNAKEHGYATFQFNQSKRNDAQSLFAAFNPNAEQSKQQFFKVESGNGKAPGKISSITNGSLNLLELGGTDFNDKSFFTGSSSIQIASHLLLEDDRFRNQPSNISGRETKRRSEFEFVMNSSLSLLADGWNVGGPKHNYNQVRGLVPSSFLDGDILNKARNLLSKSGVPIVKKLGPSDLKFGHIAIEELPKERYRNE